MQGAALCGALSMEQSYILDLIGSLWDVYHSGCPTGAAHGEDEAINRLTGAFIYHWSSRAIVYEAICEFWVAGFHRFMGCQFIRMVPPLNSPLCIHESSIIDSSHVSLLPSTATLFKLLHACQDCNEDFTELEDLLIRYNAPKHKNLSPETTQ